MLFTREDVHLHGAMILHPKIFPDSRGYFIETLKRTDLKNLGLNYDLSQENQSYSKKGVLRGIHFQKEPKSQYKFVWVAKGRIWDVIVDLRKSSPTFKQYAASELNDQNHNILFVPKGFAHGFYVLSEEACMIYGCSVEYDEKLDAGVRWNDPTLKIPWPDTKPIISDKDANLPFLHEIEPFD